MNKLIPFLASISVIVTAMLSSCDDIVISYKDDNDDNNDKIHQVLKDNPYYLMVEDVNQTWGQPADSVISSQPDSYLLLNKGELQKGESYVIYSIDVEDGDQAYLSYKFDKDNNLCAATLTFHESPYAIKACDGIYSLFDGVEYNEGDKEIKKAEDGNILTVDKSSTLAGDVMITLGFSYYVPCEKREDCVDLGLSVQWATTNLGANSPTGVGDFYSWSETRTKSEFWIDNYSFSYNYTSKYVFDYNNPLTNICGTKYDIATQQLGEGWEMPSVAAANELIEKCTWDMAEIDGTKSYIVTGPNGNSIILPIYAYSYQNKGYSDRSGLYLATGECVSKSSDGCYVISVKRSGKQYIGTIETEWKCWGYNIRPIYKK